MTNTLNMSSYDNDKLIDDYLCTIISLQYKNGYVTVQSLAKELDVLVPTVKFMIKSLISNKLIVFDFDDKIILTPLAEEKAIAIYECRKCIEEFLIKVGVYPLNAKTDAKNIEQVISSDSYEKLLIHLKKVLQEDR